MSIEDADAVPRSAVSCTITARGHSVIQDKPADLGGQDQGPMASEYLLGSLLACQLSTFVKVAAKRRADLQAVRIHGDLHFDDRGDIERVALAWSLSGGAEDKAVETVLRLTDKACTISRALSVPVEWTYSRA